MDDVQQFLSKISEDEFQSLGDLIMGNNKMESLQLSCKLISRHFPHIPDLACQQYGSYIHDMLQQSVKHYFANQHSFFGGGQQYTYCINNFFDYGEGEHLNDMYDISEDIINMTLSINSRYNVLVLDSENNINLYPNVLFLGEVSYDDEVIGLKFDIGGEERDFQLDADSFSIMNPDNSDELNLGHIQDDDDDSPDDEDDSPDDEDNMDDENNDNSQINDDINTEINIENEDNIIHALRPDEEWTGLGLGNRPISDEDLSDEEDTDDEFDAHQNELRENRWNEIEFPWQEHTTPREYYQIIEGHEYEDGDESNEENVTSLTNEDTEYTNDFTDDRNIQEYSLDMQPDDEFRNMTQNISDIENAETDVDGDRDDDETDLDDGGDDDETDLDDGGDDDETDLDDGGDDDETDLDDGGDDDETDLDDGGYDDETDLDDEGDNSDYQPEKEPSDDDLTDDDSNANYISFNE